MKNTTSKYLTVIFFILGLQQVNHAQNNNFNIEVGENQILYRDIENTLYINSNLSSEEYKVVLINCDSINQIIPNHQYVVIPGRGRVLTIEILDAKDSSIVHFSKAIKIEYLPDPELFYGISINGSKINPSAGHLFAKYPPSFNLLSLNHSFEVTSWKIIIGNKILEGNGSTITDEVKNELAKNKDAEFLSVLAIVKGPDGISRKIGGVYNRN